MGRGATLAAGALVLALAVSPVPTPPPTSAQNPQVGTGRYALGTLVVVRPDGVEERMQGRGSMRLYERDVVRTDAGSRGLIEFQDGTQVVLNAGTTFRILARWEKDKGSTRIVRIRQGEVLVRTAGGLRGRPIEIETPVANAATRETEFLVKVQEDGRTTLTVLQGKVDLGTAFGDCSPGPSTASVVERGKGCTAPQAADAQAAAAWAQPLFR